MASYIILTPPGAARNDDRARFLRDGFSGAAFVFPAIWLLAHRRWLAGTVIAAGQIVALNLMSGNGLLVTGVALQLALSLLVALEGSSYVARSLVGKGWVLQAVIPVDDLESAEDLYFMTDADETPFRAQAPVPAAGSSGRVMPGDGAMALGLFDSGGSR